MKITSVWTDASDCSCYFCINKKTHQHPINFRWELISNRLTVAESLKPEHSIMRRSCGLCGHVQELISHDEH